MKIKQLFIIILLVFNTTFSLFSIEFKNIINKDLLEIKKYLGNPNQEVFIDSTSAKTKMPQYLIDYLSQGLKIIKVKICRWVINDLNIEICFEEINNKWISFGCEIYKYK